jgi:hypothetical protein
MKDGENNVPYSGAANTEDAGPGEEEYVPIRGSLAQTQIAFELCNSKKEASKKQLTSECLRRRQRRVDYLVQRWMSRIQMRCH